MEVEKAQPEFKDGDIVVAEEDNYYDKVIFIAAIKDDIVSKALINVRYEDYEVHYNEYRFGRNRSLRLATDSEKQQLFDALASEGKAWDAEKNQVVGLKPKVKLKPFDKVLVRDSKSDNWRANLFGYIDKDGYYRCVYANWVYCIPYIGNEHLLGTTKDVEGLGKKYSEIQTKALFDTASELFINKVRRCGEDYDHRGACSNTERRIHIRNLAREAAEEASIFIEEVLNV